MTVAIVLDPAYPGLEELVEQMPIWAVDSAPHRAIAERLWQVRGADAFQGITLFKVADERDPEGNCVNVIGDVDLHHGVYSSGSKIEALKVIGTMPSDRLREELGAYGFVTLEKTLDGFIARTQ
jgi:hypothetical protein